MRSTALALPLLLLPSLVAAQLGSHVILVNNDLGMHCMNRSHRVLSVLPPYNNLQAQVIVRGDATTPPRIETSGLTLEYSFPGNTYSAGKVDFWDYAQALFGADLPPNVGLTGRTLEGVFDVDADVFRAEGIPITPFSDAAPTTEAPLQVAQIILRDGGGSELARAYPVVPVSTEMNCLSSGCHTSETAILDGHESVSGFDPSATPILCASCHGSTPLTGPSPGRAGWFSLRMHEQHKFIDQTIPGIDGCYRCHPGPNTQCLRGTMSHDFGLICQDCHGNLENVAATIEQGRVPWLDEPACRTCHTSVYGEPAGTLYHNARGHGGVLCSNCHNSPHAIFPSRDAVDNRVMVDLQGEAGTLRDCTVCHGVVPQGAGPHGYVPTAVVASEVLAAPGRLAVFPSPAQAGTGCTIRAAAGRLGGGRLLVFDARGRTIRLLEAPAGLDEQSGITWDGRDSHGQPVASGVYFLRWDDHRERAAGKVIMIR